MGSCKYCKRFIRNASNRYRHEKHYCLLNKNRVILKRVECDICGNTYSNKDNLIKYKKKYCKKKQKPLIKPKNINLVGKRPKIVIKQINRVTNQGLDLELEKQNKLLKNQIQRLKLNQHNQNNEILKLKKKLLSNNDLNANAFLIIKNNLLELLIIKMGDSDKAIDFFLGNFITKNFSKIIDKVYLENLSSDEFPIACKGSTHFRYLDKTRLLVNDKKGDQISKLLINNIQSAGLMASNILIKKHATSNVNKLYETYDILKIQTVAYDLTKHSYFSKIRKYLSKRVLNPNHPFFNNFGGYQVIKTYDSNEI